MGSAILERLVQSGFAAIGWNRTRLDHKPHLPVVDVVEKVSGSTFIVLTLFDDDAVESVLGHIENSIHPGSTVIDMGTSDPRASEMWAQRLKRKGVGWLDAPVSGGPPSAKSGELAIMVGGEPQTFELVFPLLSTLGRTVVRLGGPGAGHRGKLANQVAVALTLEAVAEALALASALGLDLRSFVQVARAGAADSFLLRTVGPRMIEGDFEVRGTVGSLFKDIQLARGHALSLERTLPGLELMHSLLQQLVESGSKDADIAFAYKPYDTKSA